MRNNSIQKLTISALLIAIGIVIPMFMPIRFVLEPASFTLASHIAVFIAMMISPSVGISVAIGTTVGFFIGPFPPVVVLRAASHIVWVALGAFYIKNHHYILRKPIGSRIFSFIIGVIHGICELIVVTAFYFGGNLSERYNTQGYVYSVLILVGLGTLIHSMIDFELALIIHKVLGKQREFNV